MAGIEGKRLMAAGTKQDPAPFPEGENPDSNKYSDYTSHETENGWRMILKLVHAEKYFYLDKPKKAE